MRFEADRVRQNVQKATTEDLLDRLTVYRAGMEPQALEIIAAELSRRGIQASDIAAHAEERSWETIPLADGTVARCSYCCRPAVRRGWGWFRLWRTIPLFPFYYSYCTDHHPGPRPRRPKDDPPADKAPPPAASSEPSVHIRRGD